MGSLWNRSGTVERYADDIRAAGAKAYFYDGGTTSPIAVYEDAAETSAHSFPVEADAYGRWPDIFVPYTVAYDVRVTTADDVQITYTQRIPNPDPIDLTVTIPAANQVQTGMIHAELLNTTKAGYVRLNGRTMGNATSGGTERAHADTVDLYTYLYNNLSDTIAPVSGGRGANAAADYAANKTITLPDCRGAHFIGIDDMGNSAAGNFSGLSFTVGSATAAGSYTGSNGVSLVTGNLPAHTHTGSTSVDGSSAAVTGNQSADHTHSGTTSAGSAHSHDAFIRDPGHKHYATAAPIAVYAGIGGPLTLSGGAGVNAVTFDSAGGTTTGVRVNDTAGGAGTDDKTATESAHTHSFTSGGVSANHTHTLNISHSHTFTTSSVGSADVFNNIPLTRLVTWYIKL